LRYHLVFDLTVLIGVCHSRFHRVLRMQSLELEMSEVTQVGRKGSEVFFDISIAAAPATVFAFLTDSKLMSCWLAHDVIATPQPGGVFRLWDPKDCWIEGAYLAAIPNQLVAFTWGGIEGLRIGQSIVSELRRNEQQRHKGE